MDYRREIDGLRAVAVLPVMMFHAGFEAFSGGFVGVDVFFVISGFLITSIIVAEKEAGAFSLVGFYERRARRILPALFVVMAACLPFAWFWLLPHDLKDFSQSVFAVSIFASNVLFWRESGYFDAAAELKPLLHTWSLAIEEQFYLLFPLFLMAAWRGGRGFVIWILLAATIASFALAQWGTYYTSAATFFLLPTRGWEMAVGALVALSDVRAKFVAVRSATRQAASLAGLMLLLYAIFTYDRATPFPGAYTLVPVIGTALLIVFATPATVVGKLLASRPLVVLGLVSYSAYLWHQPVLAFARHRVMGEPSDAALMLLLGLSLALAFLTWSLVERPFRNRKRFTRGQVFLGAAVGSLFFILLGLVGHAKDGFPGRISYSQDQLKIIESQSMDSLARGMAVEPGTCHFTQNAGIDVEVFLQGWKCKDTPLVADSIRAPFIIAGDSNAADLANVFKMNGLLPVRMTGSGCALVPSRMTRECSLLFERLRVEVSNDPEYRYLALTNLYLREELELDAIREMHDYWQGFGKKIILFTGTPRFPRHQDLVLAGVLPKIDLQREELALSYEALRFLKSKGVEVVDRNVVFCGINQCAYRSKQNKTLIADARGEHLTLEGARLFGRVLLESDTEIGRWYRSRPRE